MAAPKDAGPLLWAEMAETLTQTQKWRARLADPTDGSAPGEAEATLVQLPELVMERLWASDAPTIVGSFVQRPKPSRGALTAAGFAQTLANDFENTPCSRPTTHDVVAAVTRFLSPTKGLVWAGGSIARSIANAGRVGMLDETDIDLFVVGCNESEAEACVDSLAEFLGTILDAHDGRAEPDPETPDTHETPLERGMDGGEYLRKAAAMAAGKGLAPKDYYTAAVQHTIAEERSRPVKLVVFRTSNCVTIQVGTLSIQVVCRLYRSVAEILYGFDIAPAAVAFDGSRVVGTPLAGLAHSAGVFPLDLTARRGSYEARLCKYVGRGYGLVLPDLDIDLLCADLVPEVSEDDPVWKKASSTESLVGAFHGLSLTVGNDQPPEPNTIRATMTPVYGGDNGDYGAIPLVYSAGGPVVEFNLRKLFDKSDTSTTYFAACGGVAGPGVAPRVPWGTDVHLPDFYVRRWLTDVADRAVTGSLSLKSVCKRFPPDYVEALAGIALKYTLRGIPRRYEPRTGEIVGPWYRVPAWSQTGPEIDALVEDAAAWVAKVARGLSVPRRWMTSGEKTCLVAAASPSAASSAAGSSEAAGPPPPFTLHEMSAETWYRDYYVRRAGLPQRPVDVPHIDEIL